MGYELVGARQVHPLDVVPEFRPAAEQAARNSLWRVPNIYLCLKCLLQEYHNLRVTAFNRNVEELGKRTADLAESRSKSSFFFSSLQGRASAPAGCSPRDSGRLLSSRAVSSW